MAFAWRARIRVEVLVYSIVGQSLETLVDFINRIVK